MRCIAPPTVEDISLKLFYSSYISCRGQKGCILGKNTPEENNWATKGFSPTGQLSFKSKKPYNYSCFSMILHSESSKYCTTITGISQRSPGNLSATIALFPPVSTWKSDLLLEGANLFSLIYETNKWSPSIFPRVTSPALPPCCNLWHAGCWLMMPWGPTRGTHITFSSCCH